MHYPRFNVGWRGSEDPTSNGVLAIPHTITEAPLRLWGNNAQGDSTRCNTSVARNNPKFMAGIYYLYRRLQVWTVQGADKMCISYQSVKTSRDNFLLCPPARLWNVAGVSDWCFYDTPVACSSIQPRKNALLDISIINHSELESRGLQGLETANQDNIHTQEIFSCFVVCVLNWWSFGRFPI